MSNLPNPGTIRTTFDTYAEAQGASILSSVNHIFVGELCYVRDPQGTALTTRGGITWSPQGQATLAHWGVLGTALAPGAQGQLNEPATAETARIQAALDWTGRNGRDLHGDPGRVYGVDGPLFIGNRTGVSDIMSGIAVRTINVFVKSWSAAAGDISGADPDGWNTGGAVFTIANAAPQLRKFRLENCYIDCNRLAGCGIRALRLQGGRIVNCHVDRARSCGIEVGRPRFGQTEPINSTDTWVVGCRVREFFFSSDPADGYTDWTVRTSVGIRLCGSDARIHECVASSCKYCLVVCQGFNAFITDGVYWGNPAPAGPLPPDYGSRVTVWITRYASNLVMANNRIEDGKLLIEGAIVPVTGGDQPAFQHTYDGNKFAQYTQGQIELVAHEPNETATPLVFVGNRIGSGLNAVLNTSGAGSWGEFAGEIAANTRVDGSSFSFQGKSLVQGAFEVLSNGRLKLVGLVNPPTVATPGRAGQLLIGTDNKLYIHNGSGWYAFTGAAVV